MKTQLCFIPKIEGYGHIQRGTYYFEIRLGFQKNDWSRAFYLKYFVSGHYKKSNSIEYQ